MNAAAILAQRDVAFQSHPYTNAVRHHDIGPRIMDRGEGVYVFDSEVERD